ncbi:MAG: DUF1588 domain-containing protein [Planctomycetota bacterium]
MKHAMVRFLLFSGIMVVAANLVGAETYTPGAPSGKSFDGFVRDFLTEHCIDCHGGTDPEAGFAMDSLGPVEEANVAAWRSIWAQVTLKEMPPADTEQPGTIPRLQLRDWIVGELTEVLRDKGGFHDHLDSGKANFVDHDLLFGPMPDGIQLKLTSSPARLWRVTPDEHITRLNELINTEPKYNSEKPGLRTHGDAVPTNHGGELKLYFGTDRIIRWQGGTVAYATSVKSVPAILSTAKNHGLKNYPDLYTVNSAEATQILNVADDVLRYMAHGPLSIANPEQITDDPKSYKIEGDLRGLPTALVYSTKIVRPMTPVHDLITGEGVDEAALEAAVSYLFNALTFRPPTKAEAEQYVTIVRDAIEKLGKEDGCVLGLSAVFLDRDALFRSELSDGGNVDSSGRVMLQDWELGLAVNHALSYLPPDRELREAIESGRMRTRADVRREVKRMLEDDAIRKPRVLRFFRDYFDYDLGGYVCKDSKALAATGVSNRGTAHYRAMFDATASTDRLIELVLEKDQDVLKQLLTTTQVVSTKSDRTYFGTLRTKEERQAAVSAARAESEKRIAKLREDLETAEELLAAIEQQLEENPDDRAAEKSNLNAKKKAVTAVKRKLDAERKRKARENHQILEADLSGPDLYARVSRRSFGNGSMKPERMLAEVPADQRLGILTHPSWLVSHSDAMDNHAIRRGRWIRERLLGGGIPDVPITVDAMLPDEPKSTLRERMRVTREDYCWTCHKKMDPLGLPFEMYNHAGVFRTEEMGQPLDTSGEIIQSGDEKLDGKVDDAIELIRRLATSERTEQVFVRHAFRFWMGRNETLHDAPVLQDAFRSYKESGGSMNALIISLLTSDAFLFRTVESKTEP